MDLEKQTILIVDDVYFNAKIIEDILCEDYEVVTARSGKECLEYVKSKKVDLIILDVVMPDMDGYEVCRKLKANSTTKKIPVIFLSGRGESQNETKGLELGAVDYIIRPIHPLVIKARIKNHLALKNQRDILEKFSFRDALTGIFNRRYLDEALKKEWHGSLRKGEVLSALLIDIDYFKKYNDFYGHVAGDQCLCMVAEALQSSSLRAGDVVARYGGEEFMVILPATPQPGAVCIAQRIQNNIAALKIKNEKSPVDTYITVSTGIASTIPMVTGGQKELIEMADLALYKVKNNGRNAYQVFVDTDFKKSRSLRTRT
jgi:diguanylate cyclase (GGDEF)-like protein